MAYEKIKDLVPETEKGTFNETAVNEGVWLSTAHLDALEAQLNAADRQPEVDRLTTDLATANVSITAHEETIATKNARISELENEVENLGGKSSGEGTHLEIAEDAVTDPAPVPSYLDDNDPFNKEIDARLAAMKRASEARSFRK